MPIGFRFRKRTELKCLELKVKDKKILVFQVYINLTENFRKSFFSKWIICNSSIRTFSSPFHPPVSGQIRKLRRYFVYCFIPNFKYTIFIKFWINIYTTFSHTSNTEMNFDFFIFIDVFGVF